LAVDGLVLAALRGRIGLSRGGRANVAGLITARLVVIVLRHD
jgi:hypothetical protein